ncbi:MAG: hypothetical protein ACOYOD_13925 [Saprospiraceae bacterium]|jgi:hypothetical protein
MLLLIIPPAYIGLLALLVFALAVWRWFSQTPHRKENTPHPVPTIPPLPAMDLPNIPAPQVKTASRDLEPPIADKPAIPDIPLSEEERRTAQEYLKKKA